VTGVGAACPLPDKAPHSELDADRVYRFGLTTSSPRIVLQLGSVVRLQ
jgi:hypothetical protein